MKSCLCCICIYDSKKCESAKQLADDCEQFIPITTKGDLKQNGSKNNEYKGTPCTQTL